MVKDPRTLLSPNFEASKLDNPSTDDFLDIFEDRILQYVMEPARLLVSRGLGMQIAAIALVLPYFEVLTSWRTAETSHRNSKAFFVKGFCEVFVGQDPEETREAGELLYVEARCGMLHELLSRGPIQYDIAGPPLQFSPGSAKLGVDRYIIICPSTFVEHVYQHFAGLMRILRDPANRGARERIAKRVLEDSQDDVCVLLSPDQAQ